VNHAQHCDELDQEIDRFARSLAGADPAAPVPSCPEWTVGDLTFHLGMVHRWATVLVSRRSPARISRDEVESGGDTIDPEWIRAGGQGLVAALRAADPDDSMWAWGADQHVRFWSRRQLHETFVHRLDLELAMDVSSYVDPVVAVDATDEFLSNLKSDGDIALRAREGHDTELLLIRSTGPDATWSAQLHRDGYDFVDTPERPDAALSGPADEVLRVLLRRSDLARADVRVSGDASLVEHWLSQSAFL
jgi:uncharacterized protein (TIGR03083 family)